MWLLLSIGFIYLLLNHFSLRDRVVKLEKLVARIHFSTDNLTKEKDPAVVDAAHPLWSDGNPLMPIPVASAAGDASSAIPETYRSPQITIPPQEESAELFLISWFREQTLVKVGSIIFFLGAVWFVSYAIENNWISPLARIMLGLLLAVAIYAAGYLRKSVLQIQYQTLTALGTGVFLGTVVASQFAFITPILPASIAFILMLLSITYTLVVALHTKTQWLALAATVAGLCVPFLINAPETGATLLLTYLFLMTSSFLAVVFLTAWRAISLTLAFGITFYLLELNSNAFVSESIIWLFVVLFSVLFCVSTTVSVVRTNTPRLSDVVVLLVTTLQFVGFTIAIAPLPELTLFAAAAFTAVIGYVLRMRGEDADSVSLYLAVSLVCSLVGTTLLFDGFVLTIVYSVEALALFILSLRLATVKRSVYVAASLFILPLGSGILNLYNEVWQGGILHAEALGTMVVLLSLGAAITLVLHNSNLHSISWLRGIAGTLFFGWYGFAVLATFVVADALRANIETLFTQTFLLTIIALCVIVYTLQRVPYRTWNIGVLFTLFVPAIAALTLLAHNVWTQGITHELFLGAFFFSFCLVYLASEYWRKAKVSTVDVDFFGKIAYGFVWGILCYVMLFLSVVWHSLFDGDIARVLTALSCTVLIYLIINSMLLARFSLQRVILLLPTFVIPAVLMIPSLQFSGWGHGIMDINAVGLYATVTILILLATTLRQHKAETTEESTMLRMASSILYGISGLVVFCLVWIMSHTVIASTAIAVSVSLFLYTIVGLVSYSYGRITNHSDWRRAGILLLSAVVIRLGLVDVWNMEPVWRIVTFLGIGLLFIVTSLIERTQHKNDV